MATDPPTRLQKAKADWSGFRRWREGLNGLVIGGITAIVLAAIGSSGARDTIIAAVIAFLVGVVIMPAINFVMAWLKAPTGILTDEVKALRGDIVALRDAPVAAPVSSPSGRSWSEAPAALTNDQIRLKLLEFAQQGDALPDAKGWVGGNSLERWRASVGEFLMQHAAHLGEPFFKAGTLNEQRQALRNAADNLPASTGWTSMGRID